MRRVDGVPHVVLSLPSKQLAQALIVRVVQLERAVEMLLQDHVAGPSLQIGPIIGEAVDDERPLSRLEQLACHLSQCDALQ